MRYLLFLIGCLISSVSIAEQEMGNDTEMGRAIFAGGCFWCIEAELQELNGINSVTSGYTDGHVKNPTYQAVGTGKSGHTEAVEVLYDESKISYERLLEVFWDNIDPTDAGGQFYDRGSQYRTGIYYVNETQRELAEESKAKRQAVLDKPIVTEIKAATIFYPAEEYHQDYYKKKPTHYNSYKKGSRRKETLDAIWKNNPQN
ncbi:MAG: peptide-methionine (S)-S-oxide reductase MsrA [Rickettsiales bacterium]|nr:peptide-methionine (S)-S-oxide reductase MsrA [Rickettsiales bacterium]